MAGKLPAALELYLRSVAAQIFGGETPSFSEKDFSEEELDALRIARDNAIAAGRTFIKFDDFPTPQPPDNTIDPNMLGSRASNIFEELDLLFTDPARSAMFAIGRANFEGDTLTDQFNFHAPPDAVITPGVLSEAFTAALADPNPRAMLNLIGNVVGLRDNAGPRININLAGTPNGNN